MGSHAFLRVLLSAIFALTVAGCGGGGADGGFGGGDGGTGGGDGGGDGDGDGGGVVTPTPRLGLLDGGTFTSGAIEIGVSPLAAGGSSGLRVNVVDTANDNALITDEVSVTFSSSCATGGNGALSVIDPPVVVTTTGTATATYRAQGCSGDDVVRATAVVGGSARTAQATINVLPAALGAIEFVSATPTTIGLRGSGQPETSTIVFRVRNNSGGPVPNQSVNFSLNTNVGGIELNPSSGTTDSNGQVSVTVRSGTIHTAVRVTATTTRDGVTISSQSELLAITTGIPDQDSFSLSAECFNVEGLNIDGTEVPVTLRAADRFNNPVPDGTAIAFSTEGGAIVGSCGTVDGACSVTWTSQNPRPLSFGSSDNGPRAGRSTVQATAIGEESFTDSDGDGLFDGSEAFDDIAEPFIDINGDGIRQTNEGFLDFNSSGSFDGPDGEFNGLLCDAGGNTLVQCADPKTAPVNNSLVIIMSGSSPEISYDASPTGDVIVTGGAYDPLTGTVTVPANGIAFIRFVIRDVNDQPMPATTTVEYTVDGDGSLVGTSSFVVPCTTDDRAAANIYGVAFKGADLEVGDADGSALLELNVTTPSGLSSLFGLAVITEAPEAP